jgi:hypothetical protein
MKRWDQKCVGVIFSVLVILWITRDLQGLFGWSLLFQPKLVALFFKTKNSKKFNVNFDLLIFLRFPSDATPAVRF